VSGPRRTVSACPDCGHDDPEDLGALPDASTFAGQALATPLPGGRLRRCRRCDLRWRDPPLEPAHYTALYDNSRVDVWKPGPLRRDQRLVLDHLGRLPAGATVLDFGCYTGAMLAALPQGLKRFGIELNQAAAAQAREHAGAHVVATLAELPTGQRFDCIVAMDVIEHVPSPRGLAAELMSRLAPGGRLVLTTGDGRNWLWRRLRSRWWYCAWPEHIAFISPLWLRAHAEGLGARCVELERFNYLDRPEQGRVKRWRQFLRWWWLPGLEARHRARRMQRLGSDAPEDGVPGLGLTADHLLVVLEPLPGSPTQPAASPR